MRIGLLALTLANVVLFAGCGETDLQYCDMEALREVVYTQDGQPAYQGQALMQVSCGNGAFCHSELASGRDRYGVPAGLNYDMNVAYVSMATPTDVVKENMARLGRGLETLRDEEWRHTVYGLVLDDAMPPRGEVGDMVLAAAPRYFHEDMTEMAALETAEGRDALRNFLACGAIIVDRSIATLPAGVEGVGEFVMPRMVEPPMPNWTDIYAKVVGPFSCAASICHSATMRAGNLDMSTKAAAYMNLVGVDAMGTATAPQVSCNTTMTKRVAANMPDVSLLVQKLEGVDDAGDHVCGAPMPVGSTFPMAFVAPIREWIMNGAMDN